MYMYMYMASKCVQMYAFPPGFLQDFAQSILLGIFKAAQKLGQNPCTIVQGHWPNFIKND